MKKLSVANGTYQKDGQEKTNWVSVGVINTSQNGKEYMLIDPTINFAGFPREAGQKNVMVNMFDDSQQQPQQQGYSSSQGMNNPSPQMQQQYNQQQNPPAAAHLDMQNDNTMPQQIGTAPNGSPIYG